MDVVDIKGSERGARGARLRTWLWLGVAVAAVAAIPVVAGDPADATPVPAGATCTAGTYTVVKGDGWYLIASKLKVTMNALLAANGATTSTPLYPGMVLCVPAGSTATTAPSATTTTVKPATGAVWIKQFPVQGVCYFTDTWGAARSGGRKHEGVDIIAKSGQYIYAADDGTLTKQYIDAPGALAGNGWRLTRADGTYFFYAHLSAFASGLKVGSTVKAGQILGLVGMTGNAGTPHLHFEVHPGGGAAVNPTPVVKAVDGCKTTTVPPQPGTTPTTTPATSTPATTAPATTTPATTTPPTTTPPTTPSTTTTVPGATTTTTTPPSSAPGNSWAFIAPVTALDTGGRKLAVGTTTVKVNTLAGVPATTSGVMIRLAARNVNARGFLTVHACDTGPAGTGTLTVMPDRINAIMTLVKVTSGAFCITSNVAVDVKVEVVGHSVVGGIGVQPIVTKRAIDTRNGAPLAAMANKSATPGALGTPLGSKAVTVTVTIVNPAGAGSIGIGPCGGTPWIVPFAAKPIQVFSAIVRTNDAGVCVTPTVSAHVIVDVDGVWTGTAPLAPTAAKRVFDSRASGPITPAGKIVGMGAPNGSTRVQYTFSLISVDQPGALFVWNCNSPKPTASVAYSPAGATTSVTVTVNTTGGGMCIATTANMHVVADLVAAG